MQGEIFRVVIELAEYCFLAVEKAADGETSCKNMQGSGSNALRKTCTYDGAPRVVSDRVAQRRGTALHIRDSVKLTLV